MMFRATVLRSAAASVARAGAVRPVVSSSAVARLATRRAAPTAWVPRTAAPWTAVRCYAAAGGLDKPQVEGRIISLLQKFDKVNDPSKIQPSSHFANDLGLDSLDTVEVVMAIEEEFSIEIPDKDADQIHSVDKAVEYILSQPDAN
ncbi:Acyl carrier protein, mitochondrial [Pyricularia oryzae]|uniref:Acyl carrier protein n=1 Tax=Pyricularia grisea TaxID=148305 RepID=A0ABQ8NTT9_PYRGI|nr:Acyl carrier protein, mitochondrial [Pyricularia oryzae]KAI6274535.1 Acyl carrier protein, mitochondrial [Pyricularia oryzae]KAI6301050.1 Acyl carrier protein, mitochondrial [Pyricularia grisea]KAI6340013.1 Acyl carrier protein, mitochondrial [Pyricularia oryzae]KAI6398630.1 Acyl carrier protein, mitochondrial [Pyricularia oryzae]